MSCNKETFWQNPLGNENTVSSVYSILSPQFLEHIPETFKLFSFPILRGIMVVYKSDNCILYGIVEQLGGC